MPPAVRLAAGRFWRWWSGELLAMLPDKAHERLKRTRQRLVVEISDTRAGFALAVGDSLQRIGMVGIGPADLAGKAASEQAEAVGRIIERAGLRGAEAVLRLSNDMVLRRAVDLPAATAENLREVLGFEMDRHTPFKAQEVYYDYRVTGGDPQRKRIQVDLVVIPREILDPILRLTEAWGLDFEMLDMTEAETGRGQFTGLLPSSHRKLRGRTRRRVMIAAGAVCTLVLSAALYLPLQGKRDDLVGLERALAQARLEAAKVDEMRKQVQELDTRSRFVVEQKQRVRTATEVLSEVTRLLPDNTWVLKFGIRSNLMTVSGYSAKPSALIGLLEESELLASVRFSSPVTMDQKVGLERFNLTASVVGRKN